MTTNGGIQRHAVAFEHELDLAPVLRKQALEILQESPERRFRAALVCARTGKVVFRETKIFRRMNGEGSGAFLSALSSRLMDAKPPIVGR